MPALLLRRGWPVGKVAPGVRPHDEKPHGLGAKCALLTFHMRVEPGERVACRRRDAGKLAVEPRANEQIWLASSRAQRLIVLELPVEEEVVPACLQAQWDSDLTHAVAEVNRAPV